MKAKATAFLGLEEEMSSLGVVLGPLFLILAVILALEIPKVFNYDLLFVAVFGLILIAKLSVRGLVAALLLLSFSAGAKHVLVPFDHAWQAGLELSIGTALLITALVFEERSNWISTRENEIERSEKTVLFLEEDLAQQKELSANEVATSVEKLESMRVQVEEIQSEVSSLHVLNDVLRKKAAKLSDEKEAALSKIRQFDHREAKLQKELIRISNESALIEQNKELFKELNDTRVEKAQVKLINETLVRLHAKENSKAREFEKVCNEKENELQKVKAQIEFIKEEKFTLLEELKNLQNKPIISSEEKEELTTQVQTLRERIEQYEKIDLLYRQLKVQFEEKNKVLHETRRELFHADTKLQTVEKKLHEKDLNVAPSFKDLFEEMDEVLEENANLTQEVEELQKLVTHCLKKAPLTIPIKKKVKKKSLSSFEQSCLF
jgi:DNA repair exonuclease SbcCD ATPase subunit